MSEHNNVGSLTALAQAEANLIAGIDAATERLDAVGTTDLDDALLQLHVAANLARQRLDAALGRVGELVGGVVGSLRASADRLAADLAGSLREIVPQAVGRSPEPAPEPIPSPEDLRDADSPEPEGGSIDLSSPAPWPPEDAPEPAAATPPEPPAEPAAAGEGERVERAANPPSEGEPAPAAREEVRPDGGTRAGRKGRRK